MERHFEVELQAIREKLLAMGGLAEAMIHKSVRALVDRGLVRVAGRADVPGHPLLYATTKKFLDTFGLAGVEELPRDAELVRD